MPQIAFPPTIKRIEKTTFITPDNVVYQLDSPPERAIVSEEGLGMPEIDYIAQRGPYQDGETLRDLFLKPRVIQYVIRHNYCDRMAYWKGRAKLIDILRPNRSGKPSIGILQKTLPDGTLRVLSCIIQQGPSFAPAPANSWDAWSYTETLKFIAHNPVWSDPHLITTTYNPTLANSFPITFPYSFQGFSFVTSITYAGTWSEYPIITVNGPIGNFIITNTTTGQKIAIYYPLLAGRSYTINLSYGLKTIALDDGTSLIGNVDPNSDLALFRFDPGVNSLTFTGTAVGAQTSIAISYYNRYIGI